MIDGEGGIGEGGQQRQIEAAASKIHQPVLKRIGDLDTAQARVWQHPADHVVGRLTQLADLETRRTEFETVSDLIGLPDVRTPEDVKTLFEQQTADMASLNDAEKFQRLLRLRKMAQTSHDLRSRANEYIGASAAVEDHPELAGKDFGEMTKDELQPIGYATLYEYKDKKLPQSWDLIPSMRSITPETFNADLMARIDGQTQDAPPYKEEAAKFAHYKEGAIAEGLYYYLSERFADQIGRDVVTQEPVIYDSSHVGTLEDARRYSREIPSQLREWVDKDLTRRIFIPDYAHLRFYESDDQLAQVVDFALPDGVRDEAFQRYASVLRQPHGSSPDERKARQRETESALLAVRRKIFDRTVDVFSHATASLHPDIELSARNLAAYGISEGEGAKTYFGHHLIREDDNKPLAESVKTLRQIGHREGVYLDPLKEAMAQRIREQGLDPRQVAQEVRNAYAAKEEGGSPFDAISVEGANWFIAESLFATSSLEFTDGRVSLARQPADYQSDVGIKHTEKGLVEPALPDDGSKLTEIRRQGFKSPPRNGAVVEELATFLDGLQAA